MKTNQNYLLSTNIDSLMHEVKTEDVYEDFSSYKKSLISVMS